MKIFDKATLRLTAIYTGIVMVITIGFSVAIGLIIISEIRKPYKVPSIFQQLRVDEDFATAYDSRASNVESKVLASLVLINLSTLVISAIVSYNLACWTLRPIEKAMEDEARFVSDASHELRTPLATMRMENEILLRDKEAKKVDFKSQLQSNLEEIDKLQTMTDALLKMSSSSEITITKQDVEPIVDTAIGRVSRLAEAKDIAIVKELKPFQAVCSEDALVEILYVYLDNAIKYSSTGSTVWITNHSGHGLAVSDQGKGIAPVDLPNVFNRFYRADESRNSDGFGLGLSLASRLAERTESKVAVYNNDKGGATFTVTMKK
ncbi:MAG: HAMP domain-containing sensor histidine kinase [Candidatus Saccharibacteria bacterium]|nr:HAMP domain-containing sensor histidine kinase [Candidatus Saccharibacteria bacterium]